MASGQPYTWPFDGQVVWFGPWPLAFNVLVAIVVMTSTAVVTERIVRRFRIAPRFGIRGLLLFMAAIALSLGLLVTAREA